MPRGRKTTITDTDIATTQTDELQSSTQVCQLVEIFNDTQAHEVIFNINYPPCPNVENKARLELLKYHIALLLTIMNKNCNRKMANKILDTRPSDGYLEGAILIDDTGGFRLSSDDYDVFKSLVTLNVPIEPTSVTDTVTDSVSVTDATVVDLDNALTQELMLRLDNKYKPAVFGYGNNPITSFFQYHKSTYDLITCLTVKLLLHPRLIERLDTILKIRPAYMETFSKFTYSSSSNGGETTNGVMINDNKTRLVRDIVINIQRFVTILKTAFEDGVPPNLDDLETELFLQCGMSYDLMRESVVNFNQFQLVDMDPYKTLFGITTTLAKSTNDGTDASTKVIDKAYKVAANKIQIFRVKYNHQELSRDFDGSNNLLFHGSPMINWHSLLYNGPYVPNNKNGLIDNGAAYGIGVYLSPTSSLSIGYTGYRANYGGRHATGITLGDLDKYGDSKVMMGVFQVKGDMKRYMKASNIYVCPDTDQLCLKYLIYGSYNHINQLSQQLDNFISAGAGTIVQQTKQRQGKRGAKRLMGEIKQMTARNGMRGDDGLLFNFQLVNESINIWRISLPMEDNFRDPDYKETSSQQPQIYQDARRYKISTLEMEITFPEDYPFGPPFVRVVSPRFQFMTGHITSGGSVCTELLTRGGWVATTSVMSLILMVKQNMYDGGAQIDPTKLGQEYGYKEACAAYNRMLRNHPEWQAKPTRRG